MTTLNTHLGTNIDGGWIIYRDSDNAFRTIMKNASTQASIDTSAIVFSMEIYFGRTLKLTLTEGEGIENNDAGVIDYTLTQAQIATLPNDRYFFVIKYSIDGGDQKPLAQGYTNITNRTNPGSTTTTVNMNVNVDGVTINMAVTVGGGGGGDVSIFSSNPTLVLPSGHTFGKYSNGDTPSWTGLTAIEAILDAITDYINAVFTSFSISGQSTTVEVGTTLSGSKTFTWAITQNSSDVDTIDIYDITAAANIATGTANDGSQAVTITSKQLNSNGATQQWRGVAHDENNDNDINSTTFTVTARYYRFFGPAASSPADSAAVRALASSAFHTGATSFDMETGTTLKKFVIALPPSVTITSVIDLDALSIDITSEFTLTGTVNVTDAGSTSRAYNIYEMNVDVAYGASHTFRITTAS